MYTDFMYLFQNNRYILFLCIETKHKITLKKTNKLIAFSITHLRHLYLIDVNVTKLYRLSFISIIVVFGTNKIENNSYIWKIWVCRI